VLQVFSFIAPVLTVVPKDMVQYLLAMLKTMGQGGTYEAGIWGRLANETRAWQADNPNSAFVVTGHSLGGAIAEIVADRLALPALVWSAPGTMYSQRFFSISEERTQRDVVVIEPEFDPVPRVDKQKGVVQGIQCWSIGHQVPSLGECHKIAKSACEVWRVCGDEPRRRDFSQTCAQYVQRSELGTLYPVLNKPIVAR